MYQISQTQTIIITQLEPLDKANPQALTLTPQQANHLDVNPSSPQITKLINKLFPQITKLTKRTKRTMLK